MVLSCCFVRVAPQYFFLYSKNFLFLSSVFPVSPTILNTNTIALRSNWTLRWSAVYSEGRLVTTYTAWHRVLNKTEVADKDISSKESWLRKNVTGFKYHLELAADKRYMIAVTAWNNWGESELESSKILIISTNFVDEIIRRTKTTTKSLHTSTISSSVTRNKKIFGKICLLYDMSNLPVIGDPY